MNPFRFLTRVFIDVFGITHPTPQQERRAAWFICTLLALVVLGIVAVFVAVYSVSRRRAVSPTDFQQTRRIGPPKMT